MRSTVPGCGRVEAGQVEVVLAGVVAAVELELLVANTTATRTAIPPITSRGALSRMVCALATPDGRPAGSGALSSARALVARMDAIAAAAINFCIWFFPFFGTRGR